MDKKRQQAYEWGREAEELAADHLRREGYVIREQRWRPGAGHFEIDIIAELPGTIVFVEVKARSPLPGQPREQWQADPDAPAKAVDIRKMRRMARAADVYLRSLPYDFDYRYDIISITGTPDDHILSHLTDAFISPVTIR